MAGRSHPSSPSRGPSARSRACAAAAASSAPGKVLMRLDPGAIGELAARLPRGSVLVSATNGKTTTTRAARRDPQRAGVSLGEQPDRGRTWPGVSPRRCSPPPARAGAIAGELGLFEVDELWLDSLAAELHPRAILLGNLFRDQLDRYGELETIADRWDAAVHSGPARESTLVLNADDPAIADLGRERDAPVLYFGVEDDSLALPGMAHAADAKHCRSCGAPYVFDAVYLGHLGHYHCPSCGQTAPRAHGDRDGASPSKACDAARFTLRPPPASPRSRCRCPASTTSTTRSPPPRSPRRSDVGLPEIVAGLQGTKAAFGRAETVMYRHSSRQGPTEPEGLDARCGSCSSRTPPAPTRCCARSRSSRASTTCSVCSTTRSPTGATSPGSGTPTSSCSPGASAGPPAAARAPPSSRCA